ncbi:MAG: hypothetical protein BWY93_00734 [Euryarchaeota archaeon ADurb.BinA087]|nr:MAG: hypothetical protein BWY93_00734 [Euryarchaeota archaeon ADurb.BinA087]
MAVKDREKLLGEMPPAERKQPGPAPAGKDQGMDDTSSSMIEENMASPPLYRLFHQRQEDTNRKRHERAGEKRELFSIGLYEKDRHYLPVDCSPVTTAQNKNRIRVSCINHPALPDTIAEHSFEHSRERLPAIGIRTDGLLDLPDNPFCNEGIRMAEITKDR